MLSHSLAEDLRSSLAQTAWTNLKEVFTAVHDASDLCPPLKTALSAVIPIMDLIDRVGDVNDKFVRIANNVKGFQGIFSQYASEQEISPAMRSRLDAVILELNSVKGAIDSKTERGRLKRTLEAAGDVDKVVIAFEKLNEVINRFQLNMGLHMEHGVESIAVSMALEKLGYVAAANIDAQSSEGCLDGTRVDLLANLQAWSRDPNSLRIFWLDGMAGTGKSAVAAFILPHAT
ncbi:hypothetical protein MVEN_00346200 [Mycena venus]|uniref:NACHT-NTPase and P-loop NTPases N-terminal domain-containing protein n=1 Tax=Mycena venus TaxID=2733690 RepID=A0A8H6YR80_9AGAR|nr:hypothetical protein MVEN_00346200 [Mycena venus]